MWEVPINVFAVGAVSPDASDRATICYADISGCRLTGDWVGDCICVSPAVPVALTISLRELAAAGCVNNGEIVFVSC